VPSRFDLLIDRSGGIFSPRAGERGFLVLKVPDFRATPRIVWFSCRLETGRFLVAAFYAGVTASLTRARCVKQTLSRTRVWTQEMDFYDQVVKASRARECGYFWFV
jgi:hypothetical protein